MTQLRKLVREASVQGNVELIKTLLDVLLQLINDPDAQAAGVRAACAREAMALVEEIVRVTG